MGSEVHCPYCGNLVGFSDDKFRGMQLEDYCGGDRGCRWLLGPINMMRMLPTLTCRRQERLAEAYSNFSRAIGF